LSKNKKSVEKQIMKVTSKNGNKAKERRENK